MSETKVKQLKIGLTSTISVAFYEERYELQISTEFGKDAYNTVVIYMLPDEFKELSKQWFDLIGEVE